MKPLCIDLFCGLGGWAEGFLAEGYDVIGFDIERHDYGTGGYPGQLVIQDVTTLHGSQFKDAAVIVASPPCQKYSYMAMPWTRSKKLIQWYREDSGRRAELNALFNACIRIQIEASHAADRYIPLLVENVRGAQPWVGRSRWHYGSFHLWGDVPALMPAAGRVPLKGGYRNKGRTSGEHRWDTEFKVPGFRFDGSGRSFQSAAVKNRQISEGWRAKHYGETEKMALAGVKQAGISGQRTNGKGDAWFQDGAARHGSKSNSRKAASAQIAKIPFPLANHIARVFKPHTPGEVRR